MLFVPFPSLWLRNFSYLRDSLNCTTLLKIWRQNSQCQIYLSRNELSTQIINISSSDYIPFKNTISVPFHDLSSKGKFLFKSEYNNCPFWVFSCEELQSRKWQWGSIVPCLTGRVGRAKCWAAAVSHVSSNSFSGEYKQGSSNQQLPTDPGDHAKPDDTYLGEDSTPRSCCKANFIWLHQLPPPLVKTAPSYDN